MKKWETPCFEMLSVKVTAENGTIEDGFDCLWIGAGLNGTNVWTRGPKSGSGPIKTVTVTGSAAEELLASQQEN